MTVGLVSAMLGTPVIVVGAVARRTAALSRVAPPRHVGVGQRGFWLPPFPAPEEFTSAQARQREVLGRILLHVGACGLLAGQVWQCLAAG